MKLVLRNNSLVELNSQDIYVYNGVISTEIKFNYEQGSRDSMFIIKKIFDCKKYTGFAMKYKENNKIKWAYFTRDTLYKKGNVTPGYPKTMFNGKEIITIRTYEQDSKPGQLATNVQ